MQRITKSGDSSIERDAHCGPVSDEAWARDAQTRKRGRVEIFNTQKPNGLDNWTMDARQYELMRGHILAMIEAFGDEDGTIALSEVVAAAQEKYASHELFPKGRVRNYCTFTKVDMEARCEIERVARKSPQRIRLWRAAK